MGVRAVFHAVTGVCGCCAVLCVCVGVLCARSKKPSPNAERVCCVLCCAAFTLLAMQAHKTIRALCVRHLSIQANLIALNSREAIAR